MLTLQPRVLESTKGQTEDGESALKKKRIKGKPNPITQKSELFSSLESLLSTE